MWEEERRICGSAERQEREAWVEHRLDVGGRAPQARSLCEFHRETPTGSVYT